MVRAHHLGVRVTPSEVEHVRNLVLVHMPKTAGSAITAWAARLKLSLETGHSQRCNSTRHGHGKQPVGAVSMKHCLQAYATMATDRREVGFCVLRDPFARAVSSYNMQPLLPPVCNPQHLEQEIERTLAHGHEDNHDIPQHQFARYCRYKLCFERLDADFAGLLQRLRATRIVNPHSALAKALVNGCRKARYAAAVRTLPPGAALGTMKAQAALKKKPVAERTGSSSSVDTSSECTAVERWMAMRRNHSSTRGGTPVMHPAAVHGAAPAGRSLLLWPLPEAAHFTGLPRVRPAALGQQRGAITSSLQAGGCNTSHLSTRVRAALQQRYEKDLALRATHCRSL
jgi:hypothetical protein